MQNRFNHNVLFIKKDNSLWGYGENAFGELGDGTKVPRENEAVKIADDVTEVSPFGYAYIKTNGELWMWNENNPAPLKRHDNAHNFVNSAYGSQGISYHAPMPGVVLLNDGQVIDFLNRQEEKILMEGIKLPQTLVFP
jgi:hypothetical protein